jgi:hypothetical protein
MIYHAKSNQFTITQEQLRLASLHLFYAIKQIKVSANMPLHPFKRETCLEAPDFAMCGIISAAKALGIDLGASNFGNDIDSTDAG